MVNIEIKKIYYVANIDVTQIIYEETIKKQKVEKLLEIKGKVWSEAPSTFEAMNVLEKELKKEKK